MYFPLYSFVVKTGNVNADIVKTIKIFCQYTSVNDVRVRRQFFERITRAPLGPALREPLLSVLFDFPNVGPLPPEASRYAIEKPARDEGVEITQQKMTNKLRGQGASRSWLIERFNEIDKAVATSLSTIAERIRTRRWRERKRAKSMEHLHDVFSNLQQWTDRASRYCQRTRACSNHRERETVLDAACFSILKVGELINKVERMQHGFWEDFSAAHFLDMRRLRNLLAHKDDLTVDDVIPLEAGIVQDVRTALQRTLFPVESDGPQPRYVFTGKQYKELLSSQVGGVSKLEASLAMIDLNEHGSFVIRRLGRTEQGRILVSSSVAETLPLSIHKIQPTRFASMDNGASKPDE